MAIITEQERLFTLVCDMKQNMKTKDLIFDISFLYKKSLCSDINLYLGHGASNSTI